MVDQEMSINDIERDFTQSIMLYKGRPVKFIGIDYDYTANILYLATKRKSSVVFSLKDFKPLQGRVGMVNLHGTVVYWSRTPKRMMTFGLRFNNSIEKYVFRSGTNEAYVAYDEFKRLVSQRIAHAIMGKYPPLSKAYSLAKEYKGACAFDKQFSVVYNGEIRFKNGEVVGRLDDPGVSEFDASAIRFTDSTMCYPYLLGVMSENDIKPLK